MDPVDMDIDMIGGNDIAGRVDKVLNGSLRSPSQVPLQGTSLQSPTSIKVEEKTLTPTSNLNVNGGDRTISSENLKKKIKSEHSWEPSSWSPVRKYRKMHDILERVPPGFEAHGKNYSL